MSNGESPTKTKVVVAEDSPTQALRLRAGLESQDFAVVVAHSGREALEASRRNRPDVILSDVLMPDIDGFRLCREVQFDPELSSIPVVLRTVAFDEEEDREFALACGASAYIAKELEGEELGALLRKVTRAGVEKGARETLDERSFQDRYGERLLRRLVAEAAQVERTNETLKQMQRQLQGILDNSPMSIYVKDLEGRYLLTNKHVQKVLGLSPDEMTGRTDEDIVPGPLSTGFRSNDEQVIEQGTSVDFEESLVHDDGVHTYLSSKFPLKDDDGSIYAICGISMDITERKRLEEQLRRAQKLEVLGELAGGIAHDFNNLLAVIQNYAFFASEGLDETDPRRDDIREIAEAARRGTNLVRQLGTFTRDDFVGSEPTEVNVVIEAMEGLLRTSTGGGIELIVDLDEDLRSTTINKGHLEQILLNLVINARDAMGKKGRIIIKSSNADFDEPTGAPGNVVPAGSYVCVSVSDTGSGMSASTMEQIFEPFFTTKPEGQGTGLGLATVHRIVEAAGGCITVDSELGRGTTFTLNLPAADGASVPSDDRRADRVKAAPQGRSVLVVDDQAGIRQIVQRTLSREGYKVLAAVSAEDALELLRIHDDVGLLITDVLMSGISGTELAERLMSSKPELRVIYMSGYRGTDKGRALPGGASFIQKPFTVDDLLAQVKLVMDAGAQGAISQIR